MQYAPQTEKTSNRLNDLLKRFGLIGFGLFLIKGLLWLLLPVLLAWLNMS
jgi:hypothetical protein